MVRVTLYQLTAAELDRFTFSQLALGGREPPLLVSPLVSITSQQAPDIGKD